MSSGAIGAFRFQVFLGATRSDAGGTLSGLPGASWYQYAVDAQLSADQIAHAFTVYPSMTGSIAEAGRLLHLPPA